MDNIKEKKEQNANNTRRSSNYNYSVLICTAFNTDADKTNRLWYAIYSVFKEFVTISTSLLLNCFYIHVRVYTRLYTNFHL